MVCDVVYNDDPIGSSVITGRDGSESLLSSRVPLYIGGGGGGGGGNDSNIEMVILKVIKAFKNVHALSVRVTLSEYKFCHCVQYSSF